MGNTTDSFLPRARRRALVLAMTIAGIAVPIFARSATMAASGPSAAPTGAERLMHLVPEQIGGWKRHTLQRAALERDGKAPARVEAEFRRKDQRASMQVSDAGKPVPAPAPVDRHDDQGSERVYGEGGATVRETVRRADGLTEVAVMRPDGLTVVVQAHRVPATDLKQLALGVPFAAR